MLNIKEYDSILNNCRQIAISKNTNYGCEGLKKFHTKGIFIRMSDKMDRLHNLLYKNDKDLVGEAVEDTLSDLINYTIYCIMLHKNKLEENRAIKFDSKLKVTEICLK